jgi:glycosyltransferase involved in cell wall biosynthesis
VRIAVVADDLYPGYGGQAAATEGHIQALISLGHEVRALAGEEQTPTQPPPGVTVERLPVWRPGEKQTHLALPRSGKINGLLKWADVVQINTPTPLALRALTLARYKNVPAVMGFHTQEESAALHFSLLRGPVTVALRRWYTALYRKPDCLIAPTAFAARLVERYTPRPVHVVSNGIRLPRIGIAEEDRAAVLRRKLLDGKRHLLVNVGRLTHEKRPQDLLSLALALAERRRRDWRLVVAGSGPLCRALEERAAKLGLADEVRFLGYVPEGEKEDLLLAGDLFLMPSPTELQSIATLEAMARRCAVVSVDVPSSAVPEMVREADCGLRYRPGGPDEVVYAVEQLLDHPQELERLQENAVVAARPHDVNRSGEKLQEIYTGLLHDRKTSKKASEKPLQRTSA